MNHLDALMLEARHALRRLVHTPWLSLTLVAIVSLVVAANLAILSVLDTFVLRKVAVESPDDLVLIAATDPRTNVGGFFYSDTVSAYREVQRSLSHVAMYNGGGAFRIEPEGSAPFTAGLEAVTFEYFSVTRVRAVAGRVLSEADDVGPATVVLSSRLAERVFGGATDAVGKSLIVNGVPVVIVGVAQPGFTGLAFDAGCDLFMSFATLKILLASTLPGVRAPQLVGRLAEGVSIDDARAELAARWPAIQAEMLGSVPSAMRTTVENQRVSLDSLAHGISGFRRQYGQSLVALMGLAFVLLAVGAVNLGGLFLARGLARQHQFAVQRALGATRGRLLMQSMIEGGLLAIASLVVAVPVAWWLITTTIPMLMPRAVPLQQQTTPTPQVLLVAVAVSLFFSLMASALPLWRSVSVNAVGALHGGRSIARSPGWAGRGVLLLQVALAIVLVSGASLFVVTVANLYANDTSPRSSPIVFTRLQTRPGVRTPPTPAYVRALVDRLAEIGGVDRVVLSMNYPGFMNFPGTTTGTTVTRPGETDAALTTAAITEAVTPGFFEMFGIAQLRGRDFEWTDAGNSQQVAIINAALAGRMFPSGDPLGRELHLASPGASAEVVIVGVVADALMGRIDDPHVPVVFRPMTQDLSRAVVPIAHTRVTGDLATVRDQYIAAIDSLGRHEVSTLFTLDDWVDNALLRQRLIAGVAGAAAVLAMLLAAVGIFASLAFSVTSRVREFGIRMSIGATQRAVMAMIVREGMAVIVPGVVVGLALAIGAGRFVQSLLYGISAADPRTMITAAAVLIVVGGAAALIPAWRAARIQPMEALRQD